MSWGLALGAAFGPGVLGLLVLSLLVPTLRNGSPWLWAGLGYGVGLVLVGWLSLGLSLLGYQLGGVDLLLVALLLALTMAWRRRRGPKPAPAGSGGTPAASGRGLVILSFVLVLWVVLRTALTALTCLLEPLVQWDALAIWAFRAKVLSEETLLHTQHLQSPHLAYSNLDYPLLWPFALSFVWKVAGSHDPGVIKSLGVALTLAFAALAYGIAKERRDRVAALIFVGVLMSVPMLQTGLIRLTADAPLAFLMLGTVGSIYLAERDQRPELLAPAGILALGMILTKNEGLALWLIVFFCAACRPALNWLEERRADRALVGRLLWLGALPGTLALPWLMFRATLPRLNVDYLAHVSDATFSSVVERLPAILHGWATYLGAARDWLGVWLLVALAVLMAIRERKRPGLLFLLSCGALPLLVYTGIYLVTPLDLGLHMEVSASRLALHGLPVLLLLGFETFHFALRWPWQPSRAADPGVGRGEAGEPVPTG